MTFGKILAAGLMTAAIVFTAGSAQATPLLPGNSTSSIASLASLFAGDTLVATQGGNFSNANYGGSYTTTVYRNVGGTLDFVYSFLIAAGSNDAVNSVSMSSFAGFTTDIYSITNGQVAPSQGGQVSANGGVVKFFYNTAGVAGGQTADTLVIRTNATTYTDGTFTLQDGLAQNLCAYAPSAVPEPLTMSLMGFGLVATGLFGRRFAKR